MAANTFPTAPSAQTTGSAIGFVQFASCYWSGHSARNAWPLASAVVVLLLLNLAVNIGLNHWHRWFFDMLERREASMLPIAVAALAGLIVSGAAFAVAMVWYRMTLQLSWRQRVTEELLGSWVERSDGGSAHVPGENDGSPEYRLVEDVRLALEPVVDLAISFLNALILGSTFIGILVIIGGALSFSVFGMRVTIPGYLAIAAMAYAALLSAAMMASGQPLIRRLAEKNEAESQFLFVLTRTVEGQASGPEPGAPNNQFHEAKAAFRGALQSWRRVIREHCRLTWLTNGNSFFTPILPLLLAAPNYLNGEYSLGTVMQIVAAFAVVLGALNWLTDNYIRVAEWSASARRVDELRHALVLGVEPGSFSMLHPRPQGTASGAPRDDRRATPTRA
jgi:putative ATP-binding cassette transporter